MAAFPQRRRLDSQGFTLLELLVCLLIGAVLAALLLMACMSIRESGRRTECISNLRQLGLAFHLYAVDHEEKFPFPNNSAFGESGQHFDLCWFNALDKSLSSALTIAAAKAEERALAIKQDPIFKRFTAAWRTNAHTLKMNLYLGQCDPEGYPDEGYFWALRDFNEPSRTVLVFDGRAEGETLSDGSPSIIAQRSDGSEGYVARRHHDGANVLFVDGHVEYRREKQQMSGTQKGWEVGQTRLVWKPWDN